MLLQNGKLLINEKLVTRDILITDGKIKQISSQIEAQANQVTIDLQGKVVLPGFIDVHVHWREPGFSYKETIHHASRAAARGGFTTVMPMPNLDPVPDSLETLNLQLEIINRDSIIRAIPYGAITKKEAGKDLSDMQQLTDLVFAFSDDGRGVQDANVMYEAMLKAAQLGKPIVAHCEENSLIRGGVMHEGRRSAELQVPGIPSICESVQIARDILLAEAANCHYHVCHVSTKESVRLIRQAKQDGIRITCEVAPHHLLSIDMDIPSNDGNWKMNPPLRSKEDQQALIAGILDGTIDMIATDHAPHAAHEKCCRMEQAAFGIVGSETAFAQLYSKFVRSGILTLQQLVDLLSKNVSKCFNLPYGLLKEGSFADLTVVDLDKEYQINSDDFLSKGKNTPYLGTTVYGMPVLTLVEGKVAFNDATIQLTK